MDIRIGIPPRGRTATRILEKLGSLPGIGISRDEAEEMSFWVGAGKQMITQEYFPDDVFDVYRGLAPFDDRKMPESMQRRFIIYPNSDRAEVPDRLQLGSIRTKIGRDGVVFIGMDHVHQPVALTNGSIDIAMVGFDELANQYAPNVRGKYKTIRRWPILTRAHPVPVRIYGSMGLHDYTGHFFVSGNGFGDIKYNDGLIVNIPDGAQVLSERAYREIYKLLLRTGRSDPNLRKRGTVNGIGLEQVIADKNGLGIVIVNTGKSVEESGLWVLGPPIQYSTTVIATELEGSRTERLDRIIEALQPEAYEHTDNLLGLLGWYDSLRNNMAEKWNGFERITPETLFVDATDRSIERGFGVSMRTASESMGDAYEAQRCMRATYAGYEFLRDNCISESGTSNMLHVSDFAYFGERARNELSEFEDSVNRRHGHTPKTELKQVWYWAVLAAVKHGLRYDEIRPHMELMGGYLSQDSGEPGIDFSTKEKTAETMGKLMRYCGKRLRENELHPQEGFRMDYEEMLRKPYLKDLITDVFSGV